jgi:hypothetical protein
MEFFRKGGRNDAPEIDLDTLYYNRTSSNFLKAFRTFPILFNVTIRQLEKQVIADLKNGNTTIHKDLYKAYADNFRKGIAGVMESNNYGDKYFDLQQQLQANVSRFAAYKAYHATQNIQQQLADRNGVVRSDKDYQKFAKVVFDTYNRYQVAEYNTAVARSRTAKQWADFTDDPMGNELYPNLKWLPSRSADPREEHMAFYGLVLPKDDPFWSDNQPGNLWNCKCDWEETDEPAAGVSPRTKISATGLEGNPAETGEIFTDRASYFNVKDRNGIEKNTYTTGRNSTLTEIVNKFKDISIEKNVGDGTIQVGFNRKGFEHLQHDYFPNKWLRDEYLRNINKLVEKSEFTKSVDYKGNNPMIDKFYYFKTQLNGNEYYLNVRKLKDGKSFLYAITDKIKTA